MPGKSEEMKIFRRKFDLVKKMYFNDKVIATNKKDLIFNWFLEQFGSYDNDKKCSLTYELLWKTFHEILETEKQNSSPHRILIKSNAVMNLLNAVASYPFSNSWASVILSSVAIFLQTPTVNATLIADIDTLFLLLIATLKVICKVYESNCEDVKSLKEAKNLCSVILNILENLSASNEEEKILLLSGSLEDLALFMHIAKSDKELKRLSEKLAQKIISIIFNLKSKQYETLLTPVDTCPVEKPNTYILQFFLSLHNMLMNEDTIIHSITVNTACATLMKKLLTTFLNHNKSSLHSLKIMSLFFAVAGLDIPIIMTAKTCCNSLFKEQFSNAEVLIVGLSHVLEACSSAPQYFTTMSVPEDYVKPSVWLKGISAALLDAKISKNKSFWLKCFHSLVVISPSIIEDALPLIKTVLLSISVETTESKKQYCKLFDVVLKAHSKLHQVPKFFVKLLLALTHCIQENSGGKFLTTGQILPRVQDSIAKCVQQLPYGQMIELWKSFIETFSSLETMSERLNVTKDFMFFVAQIFSTFLLHAQLFRTNIPSNISSQFSGLIEDTSQEIKKNISSLKEKDSKFVPLQRSILCLCYAIGEVKLAYHAYYGKSLENSEAVISEGPFDFSLLHSFLGKEYVPVLEAFTKSDDRILSALVFQLLLQKVKALQFRGSDSGEYKNQMKRTIKVVLKCLQESCSGSESWDMDICTVTVKNYGTVCWKMFLKVCPLMINHLDTKYIFKFCHSAQNVVLQNDSGAKSVVLAALRGEFFRESQLFQTVFVSVIWKQEILLHSKKRSHDDMEAGQSSIDKIFLLLNAEHSKLKYAKRTPKSDKNLGRIWSDISKIADTLNDILLSQSLPKGKLRIDKIYDFLKLLNSLPLDYLLPANQMKCVIGLSLLFFLTPQSCESVEAVSLAKEISLVLISIFEGVRSVWLFDFVISGPYMRFVMQTVDSVIAVEYNDNHDWAIKLIDHVISLIARSVQSLNALELFISEFAKESICTRTTLMIHYALLKKLSQVLSHPHSKKEYEATLIKISSLASEGFMQLMKLNFKADTDDSYLVYFIKCYMHVIEIICNSSEVAKVSTKCLEPFPTVLSLFSLNKVASSTNDTFSDIYLLFVSKICKYAEKLKEFISEDFIFVSWKFLLSRFEEKKKKESLTVVESLKSGSTESSSVLGNNLCSICSCYSNEKFQLTTDENSQSTNNCDNSGKILSPLTLSKFEEESLKELSLITDDEKLGEVFQDIVKELRSFAKDPTTDVFSLQMSLLMFQGLIEANDKKCHLPLVNESIQTFLTHLSYIANQACSSAVCQIMVLIPVLDFMGFIVKGYKSLPRHVLLQSLHCVTPISLEVHNNNYAVFVKSFNAAWKLVYNLFMHHTEFILPSRAPFLSYVAKLLKSIVKAGDAEALSKCDRNTYLEVKLCAQNMDRLLTVIVRRYRTEFSKLVPYLVADYVDVVQHITLNSSIKESILSGIHRLLDICSEESIKMQATNISYVCREIYGNLVKNYKLNKHISS